MGKPQIVERIDVQTDSLVYLEHMARYRFALEHLRSGWTLDIACGSGYGADFIGKTLGGRVAAVDIHFPTLSAARRQYPGECLNFLAADGAALPFPDHCFQNIVTLETIEHIRDDHGFLDELTRVMDPTGVVVLSTPNRSYSLQHRIVNRYHVREYSVEELEELLHRYFDDVALFHQGYSEHFRFRERSYAESIQAEKKKLRLITRLAIALLYHPVKALVPASVTNFFIHSFLNVRYPRPDAADVVISSREIQDANVCLAVCRTPRPR